ncbi:hypothetical protein HHK36_008783 [Tetracentron sinense]|uniref:Uncharacterized protein n=1 Tax=Tetracentron sinense TaxID=13715 RepID=A0A834ZHD7_TETSI|nr:hypothetical protein HHK36_008783 [Tetracentron sinense]
MVAGFRRSFSFPNRLSPPEKRYHVRSTSLPCRISHPLISQLRDEIHDLRAWESKSDNPTSAWLCDGLTGLSKLHHSLDDLLQLSQTHDSLRRRSNWVENLLEVFLHFVDVYGIFRAALLGLKEEQLAAQVAIRRRDHSKIALYVKARKRMDKEMAKLASVVRSIWRRSAPRSVSVSDGDIDQLTGVLWDVNEVTVSVSIALFNGVSSSSSYMPFKSWMVWKVLKKRNKTKREEGIQEFQEVGVVESLRKEGEEEVRIMALRRLQDLEECIGGIESGSESVFRSLINTRVLLLNILTQRLSVTLWFIWKLRNDVVFNGTKPDPIATIEELERFIATLEGPRRLLKDLPDPRQPPDREWVKINVDGAALINEAATDNRIVLEDVQRLRERSSRVRFAFVPRSVNVEAHEAAQEALLQSIGLMLPPLSEESSVRSQGQGSMVLFHYDDQ